MTNEQLSNTKAFQEFLEKEVGHYHKLADACSIPANKEYFNGKAMGLEMALSELNLRIVKVEERKAQPCCAYGLCLQDAEEGSDYCRRHASLVEGKRD